MPRGISQEDVWKACDALLFEGARPTIERVRQKIGSGSPNTVGPLLDTWFKHLGGRLKDPGSFAPPPDIPDAVLQAAKHFWEAALAETRRDFDEKLGEGLRTAIVCVEAEKQKARAAESVANSAEAKARDLQVRVDELQASFEAERLQHAATTARLAAEARRVAELQQELTRCRDDVGAERQRGDAVAAAANERAKGAEHRAAMQIEFERGLRAKAEKSEASIARRFEEALRAQVAATKQLGAAETRFDSLRAESRQREQDLVGTVARLEAKLKELQAALADARQPLNQSAVRDALVDEIVAKLGSTKGTMASKIIGLKRPSRAGRK